MDDNGKPNSNRKSDPKTTVSTPSSNSSPGSSSKNADKAPDELESVSLSLSIESADVEDVAASKPDTADSSPADNKTTADAPKAAAKKRQAADKAVSESASETAPSKGRGFAVLLALLLALVALLVAGYSVWMNQQQLVQVNADQQRIEGIQRQLNGALSAQQQASSRAQALAADNRRLLDELEALSRQTRHNDARLAELAGSDRQDWLVAEVEYLLRLGNQRLNLERDVSGALAMLEAADKVLAETRNPGFDGVRMEIAREIQSLRLVPGVDRVGAVSRLQAMQDTLGEINWMPDVRFETSTPEASASNEERSWYVQLWFEVREGLGQAIRIRRTDTPVDIPLSPEQSYYLQQNARLMLEQAQLAMLRRDQNLYDRSLKRVSEWIGRALPQDDAATVTLQQLVTELEGWKVSPAVPDISGSLRLLRQRLAQTEVVLPAAEQDAGGQP